MIMKVMILVFSMLAFVTTDVRSQTLKDLTRSERLFVKNVININKKEKVIELGKRSYTSIQDVIETYFLTEE